MLSSRPRYHRIDHHGHPNLEKHIATYHLRQRTPGYLHLLEFSSAFYLHLRPWRYQQTSHDIGEILQRIAIYRQYSVTALKTHGARCRIGHYPVAYISRRQVALPVAKE